MPTVAEALTLGLRCFHAGDFEKAKALLGQTLQEDPRHVDAWNLLGATHLAQNQLDEAISCFREAIRLQPHAAPAHDNLGIALARQNRLAEAIVSYRQALRCQPKNFDTHINLGFALQRHGQLDDAVATFRQAAFLRPDLPTGYYHLGIALAKQGQLDAGIAQLQQALQLKPLYVAAHVQLGNVHALKGEGETAKACFREALRIKPDTPEALCNLGAALQREGKLDDALRYYDEAIQLKPEYPEARCNRAMAWLLLGDWERGWPEYEWRWMWRGLRPRQFTQSLWDGSPLQGRTILLHAEQGLGDTIQFIRFAEVVRQRGGQVIVECPGPLLPLLGRCRGIAGLVAWGGSLPPFDVHAPLLSVPGILGTSVSSLPAEVPYVFADPGLEEHWQSALSDRQSLRIGIAWQGNPEYPADRFRSVPLRHFAALAQVEGVRLISLQKGPGTEQVRQLADLVPLLDLGSRLDENSGAFMDTAAVMKNLDLIITSDTAIPHLAGALGVPVWTALAFVPEWRWLLDRDDSPWYPTMRVFRQREPGNWAELMARIAGELRRKVGAR